MADLIYADWLMVSGLLVLLSTAVAALVYMVGALLSNDKVKAWAKIEFVEVFYSLVLMAIVVSALGLMDGFAKQMASDPSMNLLGATVCSPTFDSSPYYAGVPCHIRLGMEYMNQLFLEGKDIAYEIYVWYSITSVIADANINLETIYEQSGVFAYNPVRGFFVVGNLVKTTMFDYTVKILTVNKFQEVFLRFTAIALFPVMFTLGVVLRSFFFTRKIGGLLMALSLALYFIFPMFYVVGDMFYGAFKLKAVAVSHDPDASALKYLYVDADGFPVLGDPNGLNMEAVKAAGSAYDASTDPDLRKLGPSTVAIDAVAGLPATGPGSESSINALDLCAQVNDKVSDFSKDGSKAISDSEILENEVSPWYDSLSSKQFDDKAATNMLLFELADPGGYIDATSRLTFFSLVFSFLGVMATIAATKSMSEMFGGDLEIAGLTHLI